MKHLKYCTKIFTKNKPLLISTTVLFLALNLFMTIRLINLSNSNFRTSELTSLDPALMLVPFIFAVIATLSYEFFSKIKLSNLDEILSSVKNGKIKFVSAEFSFMFLLSMIFTLTSIIYTCVSIYLFYSKPDLQFVLHILENFFLNYVLLSILAISFGCALSLLTKRLVAYFMLIFFIIMTQSFLVDSIAISLLSESGINIFGFVDLFDIFIPSITWTPNSYFGYSLLNYRYVTVLFWIFAAMLVMGAKLLKNKKQIIAIVVLSLALGSCFYSYLQPTSKVTYDNESIESSSVEREFYTGGTLSVDDFEQVTEAAEFNITQYDLTFSFENQLEVTAILTIDNANLKEYDFTLFHQYIVDEITDQNGNKLDFVQEYDYITVYNESELTQITMIYSGSSNTFYANDQSVVLPGYFAYYPHSGKKIVYETGTYQGFADLRVDEDTMFKVTIDSNDQFYINLDEIGFNVFEGQSDSVTIVKGFLKSVSFGDTQVVYPYLDSNSNDIEVIQQAVEELEELTQDEYKKIIILPVGLNYIESTAVFSDYIITDSFYNLCDKLELEKVAINKLELYISLDNYVNDKTAFDFYLETEIKNEEYKDYLYNYQPIYITLLEKIETYGEDNVLNQSYEYCFDDTDTREIMDFLYSIDN